MYEESAGERLAAIRVPLRRSSKRVQETGEAGADQVKETEPAVEIEAESCGEAGAVEAEAGEVGGSTKSRRWPQT